VTVNGSCDGCPFTCNLPVNITPCVPHITVLKEVACATANGCTDAGPYAKSATGVKGATCPAFCYRITVTNPALNPDGSANAVPLENITLSDPSLNLTACNAALAGVTLQPGQSATPCITGPVEHCTDFVNTVTARGVSAADHTSSTQANDTAEVHVVPISVACTITLQSDVDTDGTADDNHVTLQASGPVHLCITVTNTGQAAVTVSATGLPCTGFPDGAPLAVGGIVTFCCNFDVACPAETTINVTVTGTATSDADHPCIYDVQGQAVTTSPSSCSATVKCEVPQCVTRTQGYWFNHIIPARGQNPAGCATLSLVFQKLGGSMNLGFTTVNLDQAIGMFWTKQSENDLCKARQKLATQLIAAIANATLLNDPTPGCLPAANQLITDAQAAAASCDVARINQFQSMLDAFNNSGDNLNFPPGLSACGADQENKAYISAHSEPPGASCSACAESVLQRLPPPAN